MAKWRFRGFPSTLAGSKATAGLRTPLSMAIRVARSLRPAVPRVPAGLKLHRPLVTAFSTPCDQFLQEAHIRKSRKYEQDDDPQPAHVTQSPSRRKEARATACGRAAGSWSRSRCHAPRCRPRRAAGSGPFHRTRLRRSGTGEAPERRRSRSTFWGLPLRALTTSFQCASSHPVAGLYGLDGLSTFL